MRSWIFVAVLSTLLSCGQAQDNRRVITTNTNTRLGLLASDLNLPPVPGANPVIRPAGDDPTSQPQGCFCLPVNQACPTGLTRNAININTRIASRPDTFTGSCANIEERVCCFPQTSPIIHPGVRPQPIIPNPTLIPNPTQIGRCGQRNPQPYRQAQFSEATFGEYPWMALVLTLNDGFVGGGVLIHPNYVLTAAHKITDRQIKVRFGDHDVKSPQDHPNFPHIESRVSNVIIHPNYQPSTLLNDVALLRLSQPVNTQRFPHIDTACLPHQGQLFTGQRCWVSGWGKDAFAVNGQFQHILKEVDVPVVDHFACQERLRNSRLGHSFNLDQNSFLCAGGVLGKDACTGDGGAPLVCNVPGQGFTVAGLVAWGIGCAQSEVPGVYVNVASFSNFISQTIARG